MCDDVTMRREAARLVRAIDPITLAAEYLPDTFTKMASEEYRDAIADLLDPPDTSARIVAEMRALVQTTGPNGWVKPETLSRYADRIEAVCGDQRTGELHANRG